MRRTGAAMWGRRVVAMAGLALVPIACGNGVVPGDQKVRPQLPFAMSAQAAAESATAHEALLYPDRPVEYRLAPGVEEPARSAAAYRVVPEEVDHRRATRLARALGLEGALEASEDGTFTVASGARRLVVDTRGWRYAGEVEGSNPADVAVSCMAGQECPAPPPPAPPEGVPSATEAEKKALALLSEAGIDLRGAGTEAQQDATYGRRVTFVPQAGGREVVGLETSLTFGAHGRLDQAAGFFGRFESVGEYPLIGLEEAVERHRTGFGGGSAMLEGATVGAGMAGGGSGPSTRPGPAVSQPVEPEVVELTGVELVLEVVEPFCAGDPVYLVPAFAFEPDTVALVPAVTTADMTGLDPSPAVPEAPCPGDEPLPLPPAAKPEPADP